MAQHWSLAFALPLWILILACPELPDGVQCPTQCTCYSAEWIVQCSNASLYSLPSNFPQDAVELDLKFNHFGSLPTDFFPDLPELTTLYLGSSCVHQIEAGTFGGLKNLYHLHLDHNLLEVIPEGAFQNLTKLVFLHLEHNQIASILPGAFSSLKQLSVLDLSHNLLTELSDQTLCGLQQLRQLYLSTNLLVSLSDRALPGSLRVLNLDWNRLRSVPVAVHSAVRLSSLDLSGNLIKELTSLSFGRKLGSLKQLFLENLTLENVTTSAFKRLRRLEVLSLKNNSLETLPSLSSLRYLSALYLMGNKWLCDCNLIWLQTWQKKVIRKDRSPIECSSPQALQGQQLVNIELQKLTCPSFQYDSSIISTANAILKTPTERPLSQATAMFSTATLIISNKITTTEAAAYNNPTSGSVTHDNNHRLEEYDPCLSDHISSISTRTKSSTALVVTWSFSGDHNQFEVRYESSVDQHVLRVIGGLTEIELHQLHPGTEYRVCIIPQNNHLLDCVAPSTQQCSSGHTEAQPLPQHSHLVLGIGVSITSLAVIAVAFFAFYRWWIQPIRFQRYYNEDTSSSQIQGTAQPKLITKSIYENLDDRKHVYATAVYQQPEDKTDSCALDMPSRFPSTPFYVSP